MDALQRHYKFILALIACFFISISLLVSYNESTTMDEQAHIPAAYASVKYHDMRLNPEHPPLIKNLAGLPLLFIPNLSFPHESVFWQEGVNEQWVIGNLFIHQNNAELITFLSRIPIIFIAVLLGFFIFLWTRERVTTVAGLFAVTLYAFSPNILGHNHYVTTDLGIAAFIFIAFYFFIKFLKEPSLKNILLSGFTLGLAELTKFSAIILFPFFFLIICVYTLTLPKRKPSLSYIKLLKTRLQLLFTYAIRYTGIVCTSLILIWCVYFVNTYNMPAEKIISLTENLHNTKYAGFERDTIIMFAQNSLLKPLSEYILGIYLVLSRVDGGNTFYFFGTVYYNALPYYFPVIYIIKETVPVLLLILITTVYTIYRLFISRPLALHRSYRGLRWIKRNFSRFTISIHTHIDSYSMCGFIILYSYLSITGNLNIGFRHLFPLLPFIYILITSTLFHFILTLKDLSARRNAYSLLSILTIWIIAIPLWSYPHYLSYFNTIVGGPQNGYLYATDSNLDWGQDLKRLQTFVQKNNINAIRVHFFGGGEPRYYLGNSFKEWPKPYTENPGGWYAISALFLQENLHNSRVEEADRYTWLLPYYKTRVGDSIFIFYIPEK